MEHSILEKYLFFKTPAAKHNAKSLSFQASIYMLTYNEYISDYMAYTTIQIDVATRERLACMRSYGRETYDELLNTLLEIVPSGDDEGKYTPEFRASLLRGMSDIRNSRTHSAGDVRKILGLKRK